MPGPLPNPERRRRNAPTIPTTSLPARGRQDPPPASPLELELAGARWWAWAWSTPQAAAWSTGDLYLIARRASLEDDLEALGRVESIDLVDLIEAEIAADFRRVISHLAGLAGGRLAIFREAREIDDRLGLTPKGLAALRWSIVDDEAPGELETERPLETLTVKELKALAAARGIRLIGRPKKADLLAALEAPVAAVASLDDRRRRLTAANAP
jgi:hypothetical protein